MKHYMYILVGGGMTAASALKAIRSEDPAGTIAMFSTEANPPYARPPLTKGLWLGKPLEKIWRNVTFEGTDIYLKTAIIRLDTEKKEVEDEKGERYSYDKLLLATGGTPRHLKFGGDSIIYYRTLEDYYQVRKLSDESAHFGILGGGFIGCELAASLCQKGNKVTQIVPEEGLSWRVFPADLSQWLTDFYRQKGVEVFTQESVENLDPVPGGLSLVTSKHPSLLVDAVIAGIGITPQVALAESGGLTVENGIVVNDRLETSAPDVYAAGDAAAFFSPFLGNRMRVEHEDNSVSMGWTAGLNMAGKIEKYDHLPFFYSDMFDLGYEAVGDLNPSLEVTSDWIEPYKKGVLFYQKEGIVRGILLWNVWKKVDAAREIIQAGIPTASSKLKGLLTQ